MIDDSKHKMPPAGEEERSAAWIKRTSRTTRRLVGAGFAAVVVAVAAGFESALVVHTSGWVTAVNGVMFGALAGVSFYVYWAGAQRVGRATTLAGLSLGWGCLVLVVGWLSTSGNESSSANLAGYALSGAIIPWMIAGLTIPMAFFFRFCRKLGHGFVTIEDRIINRHKGATSTPVRAKGTGQARRVGRYTPKQPGRKRSPAGK